MRIVTGIDLVYLPRYKKALQSGGESFLRAIYHQEEIVSKESQHLAGIFALKEAVIKALSLKAGSWLDIKVAHRSDGLPQITLLYYGVKIINHSSSLSHDGDYIVAQYTALVEE